MRNVKSTISPIRTRQLACNMLAKGFAPDLVAEISGLPLSEVQAMSRATGQ